MGSLREYPAAPSIEVDKKEVDMIVLRDTQDKVLAALQSVANIIGRRHSASQLKPFEPNETARATVRFFRAAHGTHRADGRNIRSLLSAGSRQVGQWLMASGLRLDGFFSASKTDLRNAP